MRKFSDFLYHATDDGGGSADDNLTQDEIDMVQQVRNSGISPRELVRKAQENVRAGAGDKRNQAPTPEQIVAAAGKQGAMAAQGEIRKKEMLDTVKGSIDQFGKDAKFDDIDCQQIQATVSQAVVNRADYAKMTYVQTLAVIKEETQKECERRGAKGNPAATRKAAERRLDKEDDAVDSSTSGGRSAPSTDDDTREDDDFDGSLCGTGNEKCFAMTDQELSAQYSRKAQGFLKKARSAART